MATVYPAMTVREALAVLRAIPGGGEAEGPLEGARLALSNAVDGSAPGGDRLSHAAASFRGVYASLPPRLKKLADAVGEAGEFERFSGGLPTVSDPPTPEDAVEALESYVAVEAVLTTLVYAAVAVILDPEGGRFVSPSGRAFDVRFVGETFEVTTDEGCVHRIGLGGASNVSTPRSERVGGER